jgi:hypothetical protein
LFLEPPVALFLFDIKGGIYLKTKDILPGDVLFVWGKGPIDEAIEIITQGPSHCAIFLDSDTLAEAQAGRKTGKAYLSNYLAGNVRKLEVWRDETLNDNERKRIVDYAVKSFGIEYDYLAILAELARFELNIAFDHYREGKRRICSSYVNDCGKSVGRNWAKISYAPAPVDLLRGGKLTRKGVLQNGK